MKTPPIDRIAVDPDIAAGENDCPLDALQNHPPIRQNVFENALLLHATRIDHGEPFTQQPILPFPFGKNRLSTF